MIGLLWKIGEAVEAREARDLQLVMETEDTVKNKITSTTRAGSSGTNQSEEIFSLLNNT